MKIDWKHLRLDISVENTRGGWCARDVDTNADGDDDGDADSDADADAAAAVDDDADIPVEDTRGQRYI